MNILFVLQSFPTYGGIAVVTNVLANRFVKDGHHVTTASFNIRHPELKNQLDDSIDLIPLKSKPVLCQENKRILHEAVVQRKIDVIINQWGLPFTTTMLCKRAIKGTNCKLVSVLHGSPYTSKTLLRTGDKLKAANNVLSKLFYKLLFNLKSQVIKFSTRYDCRNNERYILLSKGFIKPLIDYAHVKDSSNVIAIGNPMTIPVELDGFSLENKKKQILYVGRMDYENKRVNRIVEAWEEIWKKYPDWELVLVGEGPDKDMFTNYVEQHQIGNVRFEGFHPEPPIKYYKDASILMLTSDLEGFGLVIIEGMIYGVVPIVYGSYEAVYDIIRDGISGFITPQPYSKGKTIEKMEYLINHETERKNMAKQAMIDASHFTLDSIVSIWYKTLDDVIKGK